MDISKIQSNPGAVIIEGHIQGLSNTRSLGEAGIPVYVVDRDNCLARYSKYCSGFFRCPDYLTVEFADFLIELAIDQKIKGWALVPSNDHAVYTISRHKKRLEEYYKIIAPAIDVLENIYDKSRLLSIVDKADIPFPRTYYINEPEDIEHLNINYPVIIKGRFGLSFFKTFGRKAFLANDKIELKDKLINISQKFTLNYTFVQELIFRNESNKTISFTAFCDKGEIKTYWMGAKLREHPASFGTATLAESIFNEDCLHQSQKLLATIKYTGICEIEYLFDPKDKRYKLIEINARTWLWVGLAKACGVDYVKIMYDYLNNKNPLYPSSYRTGLRWINTITDTLIVTKSLFNKELNLRNYFYSLKGRFVFAVFNSKDLMPVMVFPLLGLFLIKKRNFTN